MQIVLTDKLKAYMLEKNKKDIVVEVITSNSSDFEITELYTHFINDRQKEFFITKKKFYSRKTELGELLLPPYRLEFDNVISLDLKNFLFVKYIQQEGIKL